MYDKDTEELIHRALPLRGLDIGGLPSLLTEAYAFIVSARVQVVQPGRYKLNEEERTDLFLKLHRLGNTYETVALTLPEDHEGRASCAFVAASAHSLVARGRAASHEDDAVLPQLRVDSIPPAVSAALLFIVGEHQADAVEISRSFLPENPTESIESSLLNSIVNLVSGADGALLDIANAPLVDSRDNDDLESTAVQMLWMRIGEGIRDLSLELLGETGLNPLSYFEKVKAQSVFESDPLKDAQPRITSAYAGPHHLAQLLIAAAKALRGASVTRVPPPDGVSPEEWRGFLKHTAQRRPYLWKNHRDALSRGFLDSGTSSVITFPTGAGKTTLTELKIGATLLASRSAIYIAPTRALVDQVQKDLRSALTSPLAQRVRGSSATDALPEEDDLRLDGTSVMTPERCLALLATGSFDVSGLGLLVFDECHLLSGPPSTPDDSQPIPSRRAIDAMAALLQLTRASRDMDVILVSAMVKNATTVSSWIESLLGRRCIALDMTWKPTRQVKGIVAYEDREIEAIEAQLKDRKQRAGKKKPSKQDIDTAAAVPVGVFGLSSVWSDETLYSVIQLLGAPVRLGVNEWWKLTANRNRVAAEVAANLVSGGIKTIVFAEQIKACVAIARQAGVVLPPVSLTSDERGFLALAELELGGAEYVYSPEGTCAGVHHGLLLPYERAAIESAFKRPDGLPLIAATPTLAQGMNLPAEAVILAGDDRWESNDEEDGGERVIMPVHDILNAAGRAGRAGQFAQGVVLNVPGSVFAVAVNDNSIGFKDRERAHAVFGQSDQCLELVDPIAQILDAIHVNASSMHDNCAYFLRRLPSGTDAEREQNALGVLRSTFGYHVARLSGGAASVEQKIGVAIDELRNLPTVVAPSDWETNIATGSGVPVAAVREIATALIDDAPPESASVHDWMNWVVGFFQARPGRILDVMDASPSGLARLFVRRLVTSNWEERVAQALSVSMPQWIGGRPLSAIEPGLFSNSGRKRALPNLGIARIFATGVVPIVGSACGLILRTRKELLRAEGMELSISIFLQVLPQCVREGFDRPEKLALHQVLLGSRKTSRVEVHQLYEVIQEMVPAVANDMRFVDVLRVVRSAARRAGLI